LNILKSLLLYSGIWRDLLGFFKADPTLQGDELFREARSGSLKPTDALIVARVLQRHQPGRVLEIGSFLGVSTSWLLDASAPWQAHVTAVDPNIPHRVFPEPRRLLEQLTGTRGADRLEIVSAFFGQPLHEVPAQVPIIREGWGRTFDLVFIDGDHTYEAVRDNFRLALPLLAAGGVILFHDALSWPGVTRFLSEIKVEFSGQAEVSLLGEWDRKLLNLIGRSNDGIGYFRLL
jgi:predicted O-methyltransferase YrrM